MQLLPLDTFVDKPAHRMVQVHAPEDIPEVQQECQRIINKFEGKHISIAGLTREPFYARAGKAYAIVYTSEPVPMDVCSSRRESSSLSAKIIIIVFQRNGRSSSGRIVCARRASFLPELIRGMPKHGRPPRREGAGTTLNPRNRPFR